MKRFKMPRVSLGSNNSNSTWILETLRMTRKYADQRFAIGKLGITMNMLVTVVDSLLLHLPIDAILL